MLRFAAVVCLAALLPPLLAGCGETPMGASDGGAGAPADAPASAPPGADFSGDFDLVGTEPFWSGKVRADGLTLSRAGQAEISAANPGVRPEGDVGVWGAGHLVFKLEAEPCTDGMSDRLYAYRAEVAINGEVLRGCAAAAASQPRP
jgi:uncharacterized membrane protein